MSLSASSARNGATRNALETELATATQEFDAEMTKMAAAQVKEG